MRDHPIHVVTAWLGNTPSVAMKHYLQVVEDDFQRANGSDAQSSAPVAQNRAQRKEDTGLAPDEVLTEFAEYYLKYSRGLWPELAKSGILPEPTPEVLSEMVEDFKTRHRTGEISDTALDVYLNQGLSLGAMYPRYSDPNSQPKSIPDGEPRYKCLDRNNPPRLFGAYQGRNPRGSSQRRRPQARPLTPDPGEEGRVGPQATEKGKSEQLRDRPRGGCKSPNGSTRMGCNER